MIYEHHDNIPDDYRVSVPAVQPWARFPVCPKCGHTLGAGIYTLAVWRLCKGDCAQSYVYCTGDLDSSVNVIGIKMGDNGPQVVNQKLPIQCFGIPTEHIHMQCGRCHVNWLMGCKTK